MIKFEHTQVMNFEGAFRGMRNPMNSWDLADSYTENGEFHIGERDMDLAQRLIKAGSDHRKFLRQIIVSVDITAPRYWWTEFDTYKISTVANSCSTMHKIHAKEFTFDDFSCENLGTVAMDALGKTLAVMNNARDLYVATKNAFYWHQMIQLLPQSYNQKRTVTMNYENLRNMYHGRQNHKLDCWKYGFVEWVKSLPYAEELICFE